MATARTASVRFGRPGLLVTVALVLIVSSALALVALLSSGQRAPQRTPHALVSEADIDDLEPDLVAEVLSEGFYASLPARNFVPDEPVLERSAPINTQRHTCTPEGGRPKTGLLSYVPCCPGLSPKRSGFFIFKSWKCAADPPDDVLECVSQSLVDVNRRCDLTSKSGATSCPLSKMLEEPGQYMVYPGGDTACIFPPTLTGYGPCNGTTGSNRLSFDVLPRNPKKLLVYWQGGGACWDALTTMVKPFCTLFSAPNDPEGVLNGTDVLNRFNDFTIVQINYCSGDGHVGDKGHLLYGSGHFPHQGCQQRGYKNTMAVLGWIEKQPEFAELDELVLSGASAGSIGAQAWSYHFLETLGSRAKRTATVYDSFMAVFAKNPFVNVAGKILKNDWNVCKLKEVLPLAHQRVTCWASQLTIDTIMLPTFKRFGNGAGQTTFTIVNSKQDLVQRLFYDLTAATYIEYGAWPLATLTLEGRQYIYNQSIALLKKYTDAAPSVRVMLVDGDCHTYTELTDWYSAKAGGPGDPRGARCPTPGSSAASTGLQEVEILGDGKLTCCAHPGVESIVGGRQLLAYQSINDWDAVPLVDSSHVDTDHNPPILASLMDNCLGPLSNTTTSVQEFLFSCPPFLKYVWGL